MATNFSPCQGSYVLNQFPHIVMFGMNRFHISASGAIQGTIVSLTHLVFLLFTGKIDGEKTETVPRKGIYTSN